MIKPHDLNSTAAELDKSGVERTNAYVNLLKHIQTKRINARATKPPRSTKTAAYVCCVRFLLNDPRDVGNLLDAKKLERYNF